MRTAAFPKSILRQNRCDKFDPAGQYAGFFFGLLYNEHMNCSEIQIRKFDQLKLKELYEILKARVDVFVVEQECTYPEIDGIDYYAVHFFQTDEKGTVISYLRIFENVHGEIQIGRVLTRIRKKSLGRKILHAAADYITKTYPHRTIVLEAQTYAIGFYAKEGFRVVSEVFLEDGIPHVKMQKDPED